MKSTWIYGNAADALGSKRIVRNVFAQCKEIPCLLCYDEKKTSNDIDIKRGDMMDFPSRFFLFLLSTGVFFALAPMIPLTSGMLLILPPLLALASTALVSHIFSQKKRMDALEKEVAELKEKMENLKPTEISEGK